VGIDMLGKGMAFPVRWDVTGRPRLAEGSAKIQQAILMIMATALGERVMRPDFGCGIHDLVFQPNTATLHGVVIQQVQVALTRWEPRIDLLDVGVDVSPDTPNCLLIRVDYRIRANNATQNVVYPFVLSEGDAAVTGGRR
jgi:phage baseplate assembly protein W